MNLDVAVFLFGVLVFILVGAAIWIPYYAYSSVEKARRENRPLSQRMERFVRLVFSDDAK